MSNNYVQPGDRITYTASGTIASGAGVQLGSLLCVALGAFTNGKRGTLATQGVFKLPKLSSANITQGALLTWDVSASEFIIASAAVGDLESCAVAIAAAGASTTTVQALLCPGAGRVKAS